MRNLPPLSGFTKPANSRNGRGTVPTPYWY